MYFKLLLTGLIWLVPTLATGQAPAPVGPAPTVAKTTKTKAAPKTAPKTAPKAKPASRPAPAATLPAASAPTTRRAAPSTLPERPSPERELAPTPKARQAIQGQQPPPTSSASIHSPELEELRKFEESAFPRKRAPATTNEAATPARRPRLSTENPPAELRTPPRGRSAAARPRAKAPKGWLSRLALPDLPVRWDPRVIRYLEFYRSNPRGRSIMAHWLRRRGRYRSLIARTLKKHGVPQAIGYVAMIESGYNPRRTSRVGAAGLWQFMPRSGRGYGLNRDYWVDERRNPQLSTEAAVRYLKDLYTRFGSWELALASYNAGYGAVLKAVRKYNTNDYWQLCSYEAGLPWSTSLYVPKIMAAAIVGANKGFFGYSGGKVDPERPYTLVAVSTSVSLTHAAIAAGSSKGLLEELNPELRRGRTPPAAKSWLRVPRGTKQRFYAGLARIKGRRAQYKPYVVRLGDSAAGIAERFAITRATLRRINGVVKDAELRPGLVILVPARTQRRSRRVAAADAAKPVGEDELILVPLPRGAPRRIRGRRRVFYRVVYKDSLSEIARYMKVRPAELARWNKLDPAAKLVSGLVLQAFVPRDFDKSSVALLDPKRVRPMVAGSATFIERYEERKGRKRLVYTVRAGDSLTRLSKRFGLSVGSLMRINKFSRRTKLQAGQKVVVYVEQARLRKLRRKGAVKRRRKRAALKPRDRNKKVVALKALSPQERARKAAILEAVKQATTAEDEPAAKAAVAEPARPAKKRTAARSSKASPSKRRGVRRSSSRSAKRRSRRLRSRRSRLTRRARRSTRAPAQP
jgi:peptidoglycan lytic transglycosylase D